MVLEKTNLTFSDFPPVRPRFLIVVTATLMLWAVPGASAAAGATPAGPRDTTDLTELSLEDLLQIDVVYGASRHEQSVIEAPSSVTIVTARDIQMYGYRSLAEILASVRGFYVRDDRNYTYAGVRGFGRVGDYNSRILLLIDGHRMNGDIFDDMLLGTEGVLDVDLIDRVEIVRGPGSSLYGTNAFFGVMNVVTRGGGGPGGYQVSAGGSSYATGQGSLRYGTRLANGAEMLLSGSRYQSSGQDLRFEEFNNPATNNGLAEGIDGDEFYQLFAKARIGHLKIAALHSSRDKAIPTASFGTVFNDPNERTVDSRTFLDLSYETTIRDGLDMSGRLYYDRAYYHGDYPFDYPPLTLNRDLTRGNWWGTEARLVARPSTQHTLTAGAEYRDHFQQDLLNYDSDPYFLYVDEQHSSRDWAVFVQEEYTPRPGLIFNLGLRHDQYRSFGGSTNPRLAVIYSPVQDTALKFIYGTAFRAPNPYELFYQGSALGYKSVPGLRPESIQTAEIVVEKYWRRNLRLSASVFENDVEDLVTLATDPLDGLLYFTNQEHTRSRGAEIELERRWAKGYEVRFGHTIQETEDRQTREILVNSPKNLSKLNVLVPLPGKRMTAGLEIQYVGTRRTLADQTAPAYWLTNLNFLSRTLAKGLDLSLGVYNLLDEDYGEPGSEEHVQDLIPQNGRSFRIKVTWSFGQ